MSEAVRLDKWLWAARFYKTRGIAAESVKGGFVRFGPDELRAKPSRPVAVGDQLRIQTDHGRFRVEVVAVVAHRRPAAEAVLLYAESEESKQARAEFAAQQKLAGVPLGESGPRPTKRDRRRYEAGPARGRIQD